MTLSCLVKRIPPFGSDCSTPPRRCWSVTSPSPFGALTAEAGTSTMAVYTHFGGMDALMVEVRREGFRRLGAYMARVRTTRDPIADLAALGWAYCLNALGRPSLYRAMFFDTATDAGEAAMAAAPFLPVVECFERAIRAGRITVGDACGPAVQLWALAHGAVSLALAGMLSVDDLLRHLEEAFAASLVGHGDAPNAANRSLRAARRRMLPREGLPSLPSRGVALDAAPS